ncbi:MAG: UDP-2,3-diacylglucosamine diphosphatase [Ignavibacteria bacterium]|nr:UDP-2,3-diacylglucosamine diphosphatase [Ignavibacteria bacterium]
MLSKVVSVSTVEIQVPPGKNVVFFSDVHLGYGPKTTDVARENLLIEFLAQIAPTTHHLFIVGDLFDYWFDYETVIPRHHFRTLNCLKQLRDSGIGITYLMGNHDFGHHNFFHDELGISIERGDVDATINGTRIYISHGDGKAHNDKGYLILRSVLRNKFALWIYRKLHPNLGIGLASRTSYSSRDFTSSKEFGTKDGLRDFAAEKVAEGFQYVVMGHRHQAAFSHLEGDGISGGGVYINLGHWLTLDPHYAVFSPNQGVKLESVHDSGQQTAKT